MMFWHLDQVQPMNNATGSMDMSLSGTQETIIEADAKPAAPK